MTRALLLLIVFSFLGIVATLASGLAVASGHLGVRGHVSIALPTLVLGLAAQTVSIFYFVGTGVWVKDMVREHGLDAGFVARTREFKKNLSAWSLGAALALMAAFILGGGVDAGKVPWPVHAALAALAFLVTAVTAYRTIIIVGMNMDLQLEVDRCIGKERATPGLPSA